MDSLGDLLKKKADNIDLDARKNALDLIQTELDRLFKGQVWVNRVFDDGTLLVNTRSASMASEIRLQQVTIIENLHSSVDMKIDKIRIRIQ